MKTVSQFLDFKAAISERKNNNRVLRSEEKEVANSPVKVMCNVRTVLTAASSWKPKTQAADLSALYTAGRNKG